MPTRNAATQLIVERVESGRRDITRNLRPWIRREGPIELPMPQKRFEFNTKRGCHLFRFLFAFCGEYSALLLRDQVEVGVSV